MSLGGPDTQPGDTCRAELTFHNMAGDVVGRSEVNLAPGQTGISTLGFQEVDRQPIPVVWASVEIGDPQICPAIATMEVVSKGGTVLVLNSADLVGFNP